MANPADGQTTVDLPGAPSGFSRASTIYDSLAEGVSISGTLATTYDTNVTLGSGSKTDPAEGDTVISTGVNLGYEKHGDIWKFSTSATGSYDEYLDLADYSGLNYRLAASGAYSSGRVVASFISGVNRERGQNRFAQSLVEQTTYTDRLTVRYRLSPKTSLIGAANYSLASAGDSNFNDTTSVDFNLAALWSISPLMDLGPGFRYGIRTSEVSPDTTTLGPNFNLNYQLSTKVAVRSTFGLGYVDGDTSSSSSVNWSVTANYEASQLWGMNLTLFRDTQTNTGFSGGLDEITNYRIGYTRKIRRASLDTGLSYETRSGERSGGNPGPNRDYDYFSLDTSLTMPIYKTSADLTLSLRYQDLSADNDDQSFDGLQSGVAVSWRF